MSPKDAQWSITATRRSLSPATAPSRPHAPSVSASSNASTWCSPGARRNGTELASSRCRAGRPRLLADPLPLLVADQAPSPGGHVPARARVDDDQPRVAHVAREAPAAVAALASLRVHVRGQQLRGVARLPDLAEQLGALEVRGREVAEVLEHPVGRQSGTGCGGRTTARRSSRPASPVRSAIRRGSRGRRRPSSPGPWRTAIGSPGPTTPPVRHGVLAEVGQLVLRRVGRPVARGELLAQRR